MTLCNIFLNQFNLSCEKMLVVIKLLVLLSYFCNVKCSTHWVVTEDGRIQQQLESPFAMNEPDNLVSFMRQERMHTYLKKTKEKLLNEQAEIEKNEDKDVQLESRHYRQDPDCRAAGQKLADFDLFITSVLPLEHKDVEVSDHINVVKVPPANVRQPNCTTAHDLPYSVHAYDHLEGVQSRHLFPPHAVSGLKSTMSFLNKPDDAATAIHESLQKNSTSWVLYDLAGFYWRMKGDSTEAVECLRRALHFSPENFKDVALVSLANILHRAHYTLNATVLMLHALEISDDFSINFFTLANMYAILGEYNQSIYYYEQTLARQTDFDTARKELAAVKCQLKLQERLEKQHLSLQRTLHELQEYKVKHEQFLEKQLRFTSLHLSSKALAELHMFYEHQRMKEGTFNHNCRVRSSKGSSVLVCNLPTPDSPSEVNLDEELPSSQEEPTKPIPMEAMKTEEIEVFSRPKPKKKLKNKRSNKASEAEQSKEDDLHHVSVENKYDPSAYDWNSPNWPTLESCKEYADNYRAWDDFPSAYIDPESRGFKVRDLLTSYIGISEGEMHALPWNKPNCINLEAIETTPYDHMIELDSSAPLFKQDSFLQNFLLMHVNSGRVWPDDLGQRILSALQKALQQKDMDNAWVLYNLAGLFWRVNGDNANAIECLRRSVYRVSMQHVDIPLVSMSNVMYRMGKLNDAVHLLIYALKVNNSEPATYLSMGNALQAQDNITGAVEFYKYAMILNPSFNEAYHSLLIVKCHNLTNNHKEKSDEEILAEWNAQRLASDSSEEQGSNTHNSGYETSNANSSHRDPLIDSESADEIADSKDNQQDDVIVKLINGKSDADQLLQESDEVIKDLMNASSGDLDEKMSSARELMAKLSEMRSSLKQLVNTASDALSEELDDGTTSCDDSAVLKMDFRFVSNTSCISRLEFEAHNNKLTDHSDGLDPECSSKLLKNRHHIGNFDFITGGPKEPSFERILEEKLDADDVKKTLRSNLLSSPTSWRYYFAASYFWRILGESKKAVACLLVSLNNASDDQSDYCSMYAISDYLAVLRHYTSAIEVATELGSTYNSVEVYYLMGNIFAAHGDYINAAKQYKRALAMDEDFADCRLKFKAASCRSN